jgi:hypothetical protein
LRLLTQVAPSKRRAGCTGEETPFLPLSVGNDFEFALPRLEKQMPCWKRSNEERSDFATSTACICGLRPVARRGTHSGSEVIRIGTPHRQGPAGKTPDAADLPAESKTIWSLIPGSSVEYRAIRHERGLGLLNADGSKPNQEVIGEDDLARVRRADGGAAGATPPARRRRLIRRCSVRTGRGWRRRAMTTRRAYGTRAWWATSNEKT